jgi:hypothetical protein
MFHAYEIKHVYNQILTRHAEMRTLFGTKRADKVQITFQCEVKKNKIIGTGKAKGIKKFELLTRLTKLDDLE